MSNVVVGLWSPNTHIQRKSTASTLVHLRKAVSETYAAASASSQKGQLTSIFVSPEFLFSQTGQDDQGTTAVTRRKRNWILEKIQSMASNWPGMLLVPGTIVFREDITPESAQKAIMRLQHARTPDPKNFMGYKEDEKIRAAWDAKIKSAARQKRPVMAAYTTREVGSPADVEAYYEQQIAKLKNEVVTNPNVLKQSFLIKNRTYVFFNGERIFTYGKKTNMDDFHDDTAKGIYIPGRHEGVTRIPPGNGKLRVGFEVCLEHELGTLKQHLTANDLDLHIILSAEMPTGWQNCCVKNRGFVLHASANPILSGVIQKVQGKEGEFPVRYPDFTLGDRWDLKPREKAAGEAHFTTKGIAKHYGRVMAPTMGWNNIEPRPQEREIGGGPLRLYDIDIDNAA